GRPDRIGLAADWRVRLETYVAPRQSVARRGHGALRPTISGTGSRILRWSPNARADAPVRHRTQEQEHHMTATIETTGAPGQTPPRTPRTAARAENAVKVYGSGEAEVRALDGVTVDFEAGRFTAIMGPSGSGKSTLLHCLAGLDSLTSGSVSIGHTILGTLRDRELTRLRRDRIGFIFQAFNLLPTLTAA